MNYYNDNEPYVAQWLRTLQEVGHLPLGYVDGRSVKEVQPDDIRGYSQVHLFAGIGGWPLALMFAGWPEGRAVWSGSCPCQPFSAAGHGAGFNDERHLWPEFLRLIRECHPPTVFGEQVASKLGRAWLASVRFDLEALGYAFGAADLPAAGVGAPHIRGRLFWVAHAECDTREPRWSAVESREGTGASAERPHAESGRRRSTGRLAYAEQWAAERQRLDVAAEAGGTEGEAQERQRFWADSWASGQYVLCRDDPPRYRPIPTEPSLFPLANGVPARVGRLRAYGNAIVPQVAAVFIRSFMEATGIAQEEDHEDYA